MDVAQNQDEGLPPKPERTSESQLDPSVDRRETSVSVVGGETERFLQSSDGPEVSVMSAVPAIPMDVSQDEGLAEKRLQAPGCDFSWPMPPSMLALTVSEEASVPDSDFTWPISSALMALASALEEGIGRCTLDAYNTTSLLHSVYGFIYSNPTNPQPLQAS